MAERLATGGHSAGDRLTGSRRRRANELHERARRAPSASIPRQRPRDRRGHAAHSYRWRDETMMMREQPRRLRAHIQAEWRIIERPNESDAVSMPRHAGIELGDAPDIRHALEEGRWRDGR